MDTNSVEGFLCEVCKKAFTRKSNMVRHMADHKEEVFCCEICKKVFTRKEYLQRHMILHDAEHSCDICKKVFTRREYLKRHMPIHDSQYYFCDICKKIFTGKASLQNHMYLHDGKGFSCDICHKIFGKKINLQRHKSVHKLETFSCSICQRVLTEKSKENHMSICHGKGFPCDICKKVFTNKANMIRHTSLHNGEEISCDIYDEVSTRKRFVPNMPLDQGKRVPSDMCKKIVTNKDLSPQTRQTFSCDICKKVFGRKDSLKKHLYCHQGVQFPCTICNKVFTQKANMMTHMYLHKDKVFPCNICAKVFVREESMHNHMSLYHGQGFSCNICHSVYKTKGNLIRHKSIHNEKVFSSDTCKKISKQISGTGRFSCPHKNCWKVYRSNWRLVHHIKSAHDGIGWTSTCMDHRKDPFSNGSAAHVAGKATIDEIQEDIENVPASTVVAAKYQQWRGGMQTNGENTVLSLTTLPEECEQQRKWLAENENMVLKSLKLKSQKCKEKSDKVLKNVQVMPVSLDDVQNNCQIARESLQKSEACNSDNFVKSEEFTEQNSGLAHMVGHQKESLQFDVDLRHTIYLMKIVMEEIFSTVQTVC